MLRNRGFTMVEILIVIVVIALLASIVVLSYNNSQRQAANSIVMASARHGSEVLEIQFARQRDYPPNLAGTEYVPTDGVATALWTNAPVVRTYSPGFLTPDQNTQLFLNSCNANVPLEVGSKTYFTSCGFAGNSVNVHVKGKAGSNALIQGPVISREAAASEMVCGIPECAAIAEEIFQQFEAQGGSWPLVSSGTAVTLPEPDQVTATGPATRYCIETRSERYADIVAHIKSEDTVLSEGPCPDDPELHYP